MVGFGRVIERGIVEVLYDDREVDRGLKQTQSKTKRGFGAIGKAAAIGVGAAFAGVAVGIKKSVDAAKEAEVVDRRRIATQRALGISLTDHEEKIKRTIDATSRLAAVDDEELTDSFTRLLGVTGNVDRALALMNVTADVARGRNIGIAQATMLVTRAQLGNVGALRRLGIDTDKVTTAQDRARDAISRAKNMTDAQKRALMDAAKEQDKIATSTKAIGLLQQRYGGQAKEYGESGAAGAERWKVAVENLQEAFGARFLPIIADGLTKLSEFVGFLDRIAGAPNLQVAIDIAGQGLRDLKRKMEQAFGDIDWRGVGSQIGEQIAPAVNLGEGIMRDILNFVRGHAQEFAEVGAELAVRMIVTLTDPAFWIEHWELLAAIIATRFGGSLLRGFAGLVGRLLVPFRGLGTRILNTIEEALGPNLGRVLNDIRGAFAILWDNILGGLGKFGAALRVALVAGVLRTMTFVVDKIMGMWSTMFGILGKLPGALGAPFRSVQGHIDRAREKMRNFTDELRGVPPKKTVKVEVDITARLYNARSQRRDAMDARGGGDGNIGLGQKIDQAVRLAVNNAPNDWIFGAMSGPGGVSTTGRAMNPGGLQPYILDELALGQAMGLRLSSGYRPGSITSSGNRSLHSVGGAIDMAGSAARMGAFARAVAGRPGIAEVIYTPVGAWYPGAGWVRPTGKIAADHYDHVHVGARGDGLVGVGDGKRGKPGPYPTTAPSFHVAGVGRTSVGKLSVALAKRRRSRAVKLQGRAEAEVTRVEREVTVLDREASLKARQLESQASRTKDPRRAAQLRADAASVRANAARAGGRLYASLSSKLRSWASEAGGLGARDIEMTLRQQAEDFDFQARERGVEADDADAEAAASGAEEETPIEAGGGGGFGGAAEGAGGPSAADILAAQVAAFRSAQYGFFREFGPNVFHRTAAGLQLGSTALGPGPTVAGGNVQIVQNISHPDPDPFAILKEAEFAAKSVFA